MKVGDLVKRNRLGVLGIVIQIADKNPHTGNIDWVYRVLWAEPVDRPRLAASFLSWERIENFMSFTN